MPTLPSPTPGHQHDRLRGFLAETDGDDGRDAAFCRTALERDFLSTAQLEDALAERDRRRAEGERVRLGEILLARGMMTPQRFADVVGLQDVGLRVCLECGRVYDTSGLPEGAKLRCVKCGLELGKGPESDVRPPTGAYRPVSGVRKAPSGIRPAVQVPTDTRPRMGKYALTREIGRGGVAVVYEAEDPELKRRVALKVLRETEATAKVIARLHREAAIAAQLAHPNIVSIHEVGMARDALGQSVHFIAMDYVEGTTLAHVLAARKTALPELLRVLEQVAEAVAFAHGKGVIHRDIKPSNVLVDRHGRAVLTDFGVAHADTFETKLTREQAVIGTPQYMAPEQVQGRTEAVDERTDIYALGVMLYEMLTGRMPYDADSLADLYRRIVEEEPPRPTTASREVDDELEAVCLKAMEKSREDRYAHAHEFAADLVRHRKGEPVHAQPITGLRRLRRRLHRSRGVLVPMSIAVCIGIMLGGYFVAGITGAADPRGVPLVILAGIVNIVFILYLWRRTKSRKEIDAEAAVERARVHTDAGRSFLMRLDRLLSTASWTDGEVAPLAESAREEFRAALRESPRNPEACLEMSRAYRVEGRRDEAIEWAGRATLQATFFPTAHLERAILLLERYDEMRHDRYGRRRDPGEEGAALRKEIERELGLVKGSTRERREVLLASGILDHAEGRYEDAARQLEEYARAAVTDPEGWKWAGRAWLLIPGREGEAVESFTEALKYRPRDPVALRFRARAHYNARRLDASLADYDAAIRVRPEDPVLLNSRGVVREQRNDVDGAFADYNASLKIREAPEVYVNRGAAYRKLGRPDLALADYNRALELNPQLADALMNRGVARKAAGDFDGAIADFHAALRIAPQFASIWVNLGVSLQSQGKTDEAIRAFDEAIRLQPRFPEAYHNRASSLHEKGETARALADCDEAIRQRPDMALAWAQRGLIRMEAGSLDDAQADFEHAARLDSAEGEPHAHLGAVLMAKGRNNAALEAFNTALRLSPRCAEAHMYRGELYAAIGDRPGAEGELKKALEVSARDWPWRKRAEGKLREVRG